MCLHPYKIKNPLYNRALLASECGSTILCDRALSSNEYYLEVPCCTCSECRENYLNSILQRGLIESRSSYLFFCTLTYDNKHIPSLILPTGQKVYYSDYKHIQDCFKRFRANNVLDRDFRYLCVNEYGDTNHRPHFHLILFVAKQDTDSLNTPYVIERLLFDKIKEYFSVNVGTRKNPQYECLFTYRIRYTKNGLKTNYFVKYVSPTDSNIAQNETFQYQSYTKTLRYLLSYVNKGSAFDNVIFEALTTIDDLTLQKKLKTLLRTKVRYSKGFGCGFDCGKKLYIPRSSVRASLNTLEYTDMLKLPFFSEFVDTYPYMLQPLGEFVIRISYDLQHFTSLKDYVNSLSDTERELYFITMKYFPHFITWLYNRHFRNILTPHISYFYQFLRPYKYHKQPITTTDYIQNDIYEYLRQGVEDGISNGVPFIAFRDLANNRYTSLCKYYKERFCCQNDNIRMYRACGANNFDEWKQLFKKYINTNTEAKANGRKVTHEAELMQPNCDNVTNVTTNLYNFLTNC